MTRVTRACVTRASVTRASVTRASGPRRALATGALALCAGAAPAQTVAPPPLVRGQRLDPDGAVRVWNLVGSVRVTGWARDSVAVAARLPNGGQLFFGGGRRGVKVGAEGRDGAAAPAALELRVPRGARVWVKTASAPVVVADLTGDVELYSVSGAVTVSAGRPAVLRAESLDGAVTAADGAAVLRARTGSGAVRVGGPVDDATLTTVDGPVRLAGRVAGRARVETVTGAVDLAGPVARGAEVTVDTHAGRVAVALGPSAGAPAPALDLRTLRGRIRGPGAAGGQTVTTPGAAGAGRVAVRSFRGAIVIGRSGGRSAGRSVGQSAGAATFGPSGATPGPRLPPRVTHGHRHAR